MKRGLNLIQKFFNARALELLIVSVGAQLIIYWVMIVRPALLTTLSGRALYDLLAMLETEPLAWLRLLAAFGLLGGFYFAGWWALVRLQRQGRTHRPVWMFVLGGALAAAALLLALYPFDAADIFDNILHGRILGVYGANPFVSVINDFPDDPFAAYPAWTHSPSAYGPLWEYMAAVAARLAGDGLLANVLVFKLLPGLFYAAAVALVPLILRRSAPQRMLPAVWLLAWNPLVLYETFGHGHNDMVMVACLLTAAWAISRRHDTLSLFFLTLGGLIKFIPILLIPLACALGLARLPTLRARLRFLALSSVIVLGLAVMVYAPVWTGPEILTVERRARLFTTSLPTVGFYLLSGRVGEAEAAGLVNSVAAGLMLAFALGRAELAVRELSRAAEGRAVEVFARAAVQTLLFYLFVTVLWFHQWYLVWPVGLAVLLPPSRTWLVTLLSGFAVLSKPLLISPWVFVWGRPATKVLQELRLSLGVLALPWLIALTALWSALPRPGARRQSGSPGEQVEKSGKSPSRGTKTD